MHHTSLENQWQIHIHNKKKWIRERTSAFRWAAFEEKWLVWTRGNEAPWAHKCINWPQFRYTEIRIIIPGIILKLPICKSLLIFPQVSITECSALCWLCRMIRNKGYFTGHRLVKISISRLYCFYFTITFCEQSQFQCSKMYNIYSNEYFYFILGTEIGRIFFIPFVST